MFKYRCWTQKALDIFLQIFVMVVTKWLIKCSVGFFFCVPLGEFQLFLVICPKGPPSPWPFNTFPVSESSALALITKGERKSQSSSCSGCRRVGDGPDKGTLEGGMTLITCCGVPAWPSVPVGSSHS